MFTIVNDLKCVTISSKNLYKKHEFFSFEKMMIILNIIATYLPVFPVPEFGIALLLLLPLPMIIQIKSSILNLRVKPNSQKCMSQKLYDQITLVRNFFPLE